MDAAIFNLLILNTDASAAVTGSATQVDLLAPGRKEKSGAAASGAVKTALACCYGYKTPL